MGQTDHILETNNIYLPATYKVSFYYMESIKGYRKTAGFLVLGTFEKKKVPKNGYSLKMVWCFSNSRITKVFWHTYLKQAVIIQCEYLLFTKFVHTTIH